MTGDCRFQTPTCLKCGSLLATAYCIEKGGRETRAGKCPRCNTKYIIEKKTTFTLTEIEK